MMSADQAIVASAVEWLSARTEAIRLLGNGEPASAAVSALGAAEARLAEAVRAPLEHE